MGEDTTIKQFHMDDLEIYFPEFAPSGKFSSNITKRSFSDIIKLFENYRLCDFCGKFYVLLINKNDSKICCDNFKCIIKKTLYEQEINKKII